MKSRIALIAIIVFPTLSAGGMTRADIPLSRCPLWQDGFGEWPTGIGWADIDGDGWLDLVIAAGVDAESKPNVVYFNRGGRLEASPGWCSTDLNTSCLLAVGDLDNDSDLDLAGTDHRSLRYVQVKWPVAGYRGLSFF